MNANESSEDIAACQVFADMPCLSDPTTSDCQTSMLSRYISSSPTITERLVNRLPKQSATESIAEMEGYFQRFNDATKRCRSSIKRVDQEQGHEAFDEDSLAVELEMMVQNIEKSEEDEVSKARKRCGG